MTAPPDIAWLQADGGYAVALRGGQVVARGPRGAVLNSVLSALRDSEVVRQLRELRDRLSRLERECLAAIETWMVRSLPVPTRVLRADCPDPEWQRLLGDAIVVPLDEAGHDVFLAGSWEDLKAPAFDPLPSSTTGRRA